MRPHRPITLVLLLFLVASLYILFGNNSHAQSLTETLSGKYNGEKQDLAAGSNQGNQDGKDKEKEKDEVTTTVAAAVETKKAADSKPKTSKGKEKATFVTLARNNDLDNLLNSVRSVEDRFNRNYNYDWVFLNEEDFTEEFKQVMTGIVSGTAKFGKVPEEHWGYPDFIDQEKAKQGREKLQQEGVIYASNEPYRFMCRYESGFFYRHPLMQDYRYYWRVEPETLLHCDINYDVFEYMRVNNKKYGWTISITEWEKTIKTLWNTTKSFIHEHADYVHKDSAYKFLTNDDLDTYNLCHYWSNFEVADMEFWKGEAYDAYFNYLDKSGGFFYERWGDAPVHSIAASLFLPKDQLHFFDDIGYTHPPFTHCPANQAAKGLTCSCRESQSFDNHQSSCLRNYMDAKGIDAPEKDL